MKKPFVIPAAMVMTIAMAATVMAATWRTGATPNESRWWFDDEDGTYAVNEWRWLSGQ